MSYRNFDTGTYESRILREIMTIISIIIIGICVLVYYINNIPIYLGTKSFIPYSLKPGTFLNTPIRWIGGRPSIISNILIAILIIGIILYLIKLFSRKNREIFKKENKILKLAIFIIALIAFRVTYLNVSIVTSIIIISISLLALYKLLNKAEMDDFNLDSIMFYWMVVNFLFITYYHVKVDRYFMPILPAAAYFMILSIEFIFLLPIFIFISNESFNIIKSMFQIHFTHSPVHFTS